MTPLRRVARIPESSAACAASGSRVVRDTGSITVRAYRGSTLLTNGDRVTESPGVAERRATQIADLLRGLGAAAAFFVSDNSGNTFEFIERR